MQRRELLKQAGSLVLGGNLAADPPTPAAAAGSGVFAASDFGAQADGKADDTAAIQKALDAAGSQGGIVQLVGGAYRVDGVLSVPQSVCLRGTAESPPRTGPGGGGTVLLATAGKGQETGTPFVTLRTNSTLKGLAVYYPDQDSEVVPYPPTVQGQGDDCSLVDVLLVNPYFGVDLGAHPCGRHWIKSLYMQALARGIYVAECFDVGRIEDVHVWPFWRAADAKVQAFTARHGEAFVLGRTDWEYMINCFCIGYRVGYRFIASKSGPGNVVLTQCGSDEGPQSTSVLVEATQGHAGVSFVNGQFMGRKHVEVRPTNSGPVKFTSCGFWGMGGVTASMALLQCAGQVSFHGCHFTGWAQAGDAAAPALIAERGGLSVSGCDFMDAGKNQIRLGPGIDSAVVIGSRLRGGARIANEAGARTQLGLNVEG